MTFDIIIIYKFSPQAEQHSQTNENKKRKKKQIINYNVHAKQIHKTVWHTKFYKIEKKIHRECNWTTKFVPPVLTAPWMVEKRHTFQNKQKHLPKKKTNKRQKLFSTCSPFFFFFCCCRCTAAVVIALSRSFHVFSEFWVNIAPFFCVCSL